MSWSERSWADGPRWPTVRSGAPEKLHFLAHGTRRLVVGALSPDSRPTHTQPLSVKERPRSQNHSHPGEMRLKPYSPKLHQLSEANHKLPVSSQRPKTFCQPIRVPALSRSPPTLWAAFLRVAPSLQMGRCTIEDGQIGRWPSPKKWLCCKLIVEVFLSILTKSLCR